MKRWFINGEGRWRSGVWVLLFVLGIVATRFLFKPVDDGLETLGLGDFWREALPFVFVLAVTWACLRLRGETLAHVGFRLGKRWFAEFAAGSLLGLVLMAGIVGIIAALGGVQLVAAPGRSVDTLLWALVAFAFVALFEETLFRGFLFQRLVDGLGAWPAMLLMALAFAAGHGDNPGMTGATAFWASLDLALGAILLGLAWLRTRSLALPIGIHLTWNWAQGSLFGFGVSGLDQQGWWQPVFTGQPQWLTGGEFGPEASVVAVCVDAVAIVLLWRWRGTVPVPAVAADAARPAPAPA